MKKEFLKENSKLSSMRWALVQVIRMAWLLIGAGVFHIVFYTAKSQQIDWAGILMLLGGVTTFTGAAITGKFIQKKQEVKDET